MHVTHLLVSTTGNATVCGARHEPKSDNEPTKLCVYCYMAVSDVSDAG